LRLNVFLALYGCIRRTGNRWRRIVYRKHLGALGSAATLIRDRIDHIIVRLAVIRFRL
jgi:hypothetical protein